jgi:hypothetical protein
MCKKPKKDDYFVCPCCGTDVAIGAVVCPECGASDEFGWDEGDGWDDELPPGYASSDESEYEDFIRREFPQHASPEHRRKRGAVTLMAVLTCIGLLLYMVVWRCSR